MARKPRGDGTARGEPVVSRSNRRLIAVGLAALTCFAIATLPASLAARTFKRFGLEATEYSGTIWSGAATGVAWRGAAIGELGWKLRPLALLRARVAAEVSLVRPDGSANTAVAASPGGALEFTDLRIDLPLEFLAALPMGLPQGWRGRAQGTIDELRLVAGWPVRAQGTINLIGLVVPRLSPTAIGSFEIRVPDPRATATATAVTARVTDKDALLSIDAVLTLASGRSFSLDGTVAPRGTAPPGLLQALEYLGPADAAGRRPIGASGTL
jgi:general secretion pathway protein N